MPLPIGVETTFKVARAEIKKTLPPKDGKGPATIIKLGLVAPDGEKGWAEFFCPDGTLPPGEDTSETFILENSDYGLKAKRPRKGGWGGGGRKVDPAEDAARQAMIIAQSARTAAIEEMRMMFTVDPKLAQGTNLKDIRDSIDNRVAAITLQALNLGDEERQAAKERK